MRVACTVLACAVLGALPAAQAVSAAPRVVLIHNARIAGAPGADALVLAGDRIVASGSERELAPHLPDARRVDAHGGLVLPGLMDPHVHLQDVGLAPRRVKLYELPSLTAALEAVRAYAKSHQQASWVLGGGWSYELTPGGYPTRQALDAVVPDRPVYLESYDGHAIWCNSRALAAAGITAATPDPEGGRIVREADGRTPAGTLLEAAGELAGAVVPPAPRAERKDALRDGAAACAARGITALDEIMADDDEAELLLELAAENQLPVRVRACPALVDDLGVARRLRARLRGTPVKMGFLKGFVDGVIESRTAVMVDPYPGGVAHGTGLMSPEVLGRRVLAAHRDGFQVALHATGEGGVRMALDAYAATRARPRRGPPHRIEHCEMVRPEDRARFARLDVIPSMQPMHALPTGPEPDQGVWSLNVGHLRMHNTFPWRSLLDAGATLAFGSDAPVVPPEPLPGIAVAITRENPAGQPAGGWNPAQRITPTEALAAYTRGAARSMGMEDACGSLAAGMLADLVVLGPDVDLARPATLWKPRIAHVFVGGTRVAGADDYPAR